MTIRILLVDDHKIVREGLRALLERQGLEVVGEADNGRDAVKLARKIAPDIVIMDVTMPGLNGIEATRQIVSETRGIRVIGLSMHSDRRYVLRMFTEGASGYLLKNCAFKELVLAIQTVLDGEAYISPGIAGGLIREYAKNPQDITQPNDVLTPREKEVLQLISEGRSTKKTAELMGVSAKTVESHRRSIMNKLNLYTIAELTKYAVREGMTTLGP